MPGIGIIANPHSKLNKRDPWRKNLLSYIVGSQGQLEVTQSLDQLRSVARDFLKQGIEIIAINGGDGTISQTLTALIEIYGAEPLPQIALIKGGTMNMLATNLGIRGSPEQILYRLIETYSTGRLLKRIPLSCLKINNNYGFLFGNGIASNFLAEFYRNKTGPAGAAWLILKIMASRGTLHRRVVSSDWVELRLDSEPPIRHETCGILCSTVRQMPMGMPLFHTLGAQNAESAEVLSFTIPARKAVWQLPGAVIRKALRIDSGNQPCRQFSTNARNIEITAHIHKNYTLDGELFDVQDHAIKIELGPSINFVTV